MSEPFDLGPAKLLRLSGTDARRFAQAQFCNDVDALAPDGWQWNGWLDPQGRVRAFFALIAIDVETLLAWLPMGDATAMKDALRPFVFRSKVAIDVIDDWSASGWIGVDDDAPSLCAAGTGWQLRLGGTASRWIVLAPGSAPVDPDRLATWRGFDIDDGLPLLDAAVAGEFVPQALGFEAISAISFRKGCYPGQEIAARLHFRGGNKRHLRRLRWHGRTDEASPGLPLRTIDGDSTVGQLLYAGADAGGAKGLAVMQDSANDLPAVLAGDHMTALLA